MSHERKRKDRQSKYRDQSGSFRSSMPRWTDMGNVNDGYGGYEYMDPWGKMGLKYAPQYYHNEPGSRYADPSENSSSSGYTDSYVQNEKPVRKKLQGRKLALIVIVVGLVAIAAAITAILVLSLKPVESQPNKFRVVTMSLSVAETFKPEYKNQSSSEYKLFAGNFTSAMDEIFQANNTKGYKGIQIVELKNGSVVVIFTVVIEFKQSEGPPGDDVLKTIITGQKIYENDNNNVVVKNFKILKASISIVKTEEFASNPISTTAEPRSISTTAAKATTTTSITSPPSQGQDNFNVATVNLAVDDTFKPEYNNTSSVEYQIFAADFTNAMDKIFNNTEGYKGSQIKELKTGSVIVIFIIVIEVKSNVKPLGEEELKAVITGQKRDENDNATVVIERFRIQTTSVSIVAIEKVKANPIFPTADSTTTKSSTPATTFPPSTSTTVKANVTASTSASNVQLNSSTTPSTLAVSTPPTPTSSTLQPSTTTTSTSTITTTATTTITSPNTTVQKVISTTTATSTTKSSIITNSTTSPKPDEANMTSTTTSTTTISLRPATNNTTWSSNPTSVITATTASTLTTAANGTTPGISSTKPQEPNTTSATTPTSATSSKTTSTTPNTTASLTSTITSTISTKSLEPTTTTATTSVSIATSINTTLSTTTEPNTTTTTSTSTTITKPTTTTTSSKVPELSTTLFNPSTISTTLSNSPAATMATTTSSTTTTATTATSTTKSSIITYSTTSPKPDEANMTSTTTSTTTISIKPGINSTTWSNNPTSVMSATTASTLTTAANGTTPGISSTKPLELNTTNATTPTSATNSTTTSTTPNTTASLTSTITSTISTKSLEPTTTTATTSVSIATSINTTLSTTTEPNTTTTTSTSTTITKPTTTTTSSKVPELSTTSFNPSTISTTLSNSPAATMATTTSSTTTTATTATSTTKSSIITYSTTSPKPDEANMTSTTTSTTTISIKPGINSTTWSNNPTSVMSATTASTLTTAANGTTPGISSTKPLELNTTNATTPTSATNSTTTSTTPTPTASLTSTITSTISTKSLEPTTTTATTSVSIATSINTTLSTTTEPNTATTTSTSTTITKPTTTTTSSKVPELSTTSFNPSTISTTLSNSPAATMATTTSSTTTTATTATSTTKSSIITYSTTSPKPDEANMTSTTTSTTTISIKPGTNSTTWSNNPTSVMSATTASTLTTAANGTTPGISSTKPLEPNTTNATTPTSATNSTTTSTTPTPTASLTSTITSTISTKSLEPTTITATTSESIATSINTTLSTTSLKPTETNLTSTTTSTSITNLNPITTSIVLQNITGLNTTITSTSTSTTTLMPKTTSTFLQSSSEPNATNATTWTTTYSTKPSSTVPSTMATTNSSTVSTVSTNSTMGPSSTSYKTIATTITTPKGVAFNTKNYMAVVGVSLELMCTVTGWNGNLSISRLSRTNQQEIMVVNFVNNKTGTILNGFAVNITFTGYSVDVSIFILNVSCEDEGTYYCTRGAVSDNATVKREREKPILQLPDIMVRDGFHNVKYPFVCETDIEDSGEILIAEVNQNGTFYLYEGYAESRVNITTDCGNKQRFTFYINGKFISVWDNAKIRCVLINNSTNGNTGIRLVSEESTIRLVPADICMGVTQGSNISYPQNNCELFLTCLSGEPVPGKCKQGQCFYDNIGMCRAPICPFVYCNDADANIGEPTSITCSLLFCNDSFSLTIKHLGDTLFSSNNITGNISQHSEDKNIQIWLTKGKAELTVAFLKTNCNHSGEYIIILGKENVTDRGYLTFKVPPRKPTLLLPQSIVAYTQATITCSGEQGIPRQNMYIEVMFNGSNYTKYEKAILTTDDKNCSSMGTLVMNFLVVEKWQHARVRCVIGDNSSSRLESDVYEINTTSSGISISPSEITGFINDTVQINCTVTGILSNDSVIISRFIPTFQGEEILSILTNGNSIKNNLTWIRFSTTVVSQNDMIIHININVLQCRDGGTYRCKTGNRTAIASLEILRKPDKPTLKLPVNVISDGYNQLGDPFVCEGNVGYPGGNLTVLFNKDGNFRDAQPVKANMITGNVTECRRVDRFEFYLNTFTTDLHNTTVRCVATNNNTLSGESAPFDDKVLLLVQGNKCYGAQEGLNLPYPYPSYDCGKYLYCSWNQTFVKDGGCKDGECFYTDIKRCEPERTTTTTKPTTTTQVACPSVACSGAEPVINSDATITCVLILCGDEFDLIIELDSKVQFRETMRVNRTYPFLNNALLNLVVVDNNTAKLNIAFKNITCNQSGAYNVSIYGGNVSSAAEIRVRVNSEKPNITAPPNIYKDQKAIISCIGQLGIPIASMFWQLKLPGGNFKSYSVNGSPDINESNCSVIGNWTIGIYPEQSWNGGGIRCVTKTQGNPSMELYSDTITITIEEPDIYFVPSSSYGYIGSSHSVTCIARDMANIMSVKIERKTIYGLHEVASLAIDGTSQTSFIGIRIRNSSMINSTAATVYIDFDNLTCSDKGDYFCTIGAFSSRGNLSVLRIPEVPQMVTFPTSGILQNTASETINCTGEVGYSARKIVFESNKGGNNTFTPVPFNFTSTQMEGECSNAYSATFSYRFGMDWNNTVIRCKIDTVDVLGVTGSSLYVDRKVLIIPGNICNTYNAEYVPHPYACRKYVRCADRIYLQECAPPLCHLTVPVNSTPCGYCNGCIDSF